MTMLIKGGLLYCMTGQKSCIGDILIQGGRIAAIKEEIKPKDDTSTCILEARGLTILPGLIDPHINDSPETEPDLLHQAQSAGVTTGLLWPEGEGTCHILSREGKAPSSVYALKPAQYTDAQLHHRLLALANEGYRPACKIHSAEECRRMLASVHSSGVKVMLVHLSGCEQMLEAIAMAECPVIIGVSTARHSSPWKMVRQLDALGVPVALTCNHPGAKLCHLPLCAAMCAREGMNRERALHAVTTAPAALLGLSDAGRISVGSRADLAIYDGDPLLLATSHVMTISGGKIRY